MRKLAIFVIGVIVGFVGGAFVPPPDELKHKQGGFTGR